MIRDKEGGIGDAKGDGEERHGERSEEKEVGGEGEGESARGGPDNGGRDWRYEKK